MSAPGALCYFCLGEEVDEEGKPPVRDCSCRGAGFAHFHLSCFTTFAKQKSKQASERDIGAYLLNLGKIAPIANSRSKVNFQ
jgi:hypothetical protein